MVVAKPDSDRISIARRATTLPTAALRFYLQGHTRQTLLSADQKVLEGSANHWPGLRNSLAWRVWHLGKEISAHHLPGQFASFPFLPFSSSFCFFLAPSPPSPAPLFHLHPKSLSHTLITRLTHHWISARDSGFDPAVSFPLLSPSLASHKVASCCPPTQGCFQSAAHPPTSWHSYLLHLVPSDVLSRSRFLHQDTCRRVWH